MYDIEFLKNNLENKLIYFDTIDSTNEEAKRRIQRETEDYIILAAGQTAGRGRKGRDFYSPKNQGIYVTFTHYTEKNIEEVIHVTTALSVIVRRAILETYGISCKIKWVNDLYYKDKKVCGILCECILPDSNDDRTAIICGIGINISTDSFPDDLQNKAGNISDVDDALKNSEIILLIEKGLKEFYNESLNYMDDYIDNSLVIGKEVELFDQNGKILSGLVKDFDENGAIMIEDNSGRVKTINSGEISLVMK